MPRHTAPAPRQPGRRRFARALAAACALSACPWPQAAPPPSPPPSSLPQRNLVIEWRQIDESLALSTGAAAQATVVTSNGGVSTSGGVSVSTQRRDDQRTQSQQLRVLNGTRAVVRVNHSVPVVWESAVLADAGGGAYPRRGGATGVEHGVAWLDAGRQISLLPRWPGGEQPAVVDIQVDAAGLADELPAAAAQGATPLPVQVRTQTVTTVSAPLGRWVTIARTGEQVVQEAGTVSTQSAHGAQRQLMQIRVLVP